MIKAQLTNKMKTRFVLTFASVCAVFLVVNSLTFLTVRFDTVTFLHRYDKTYSIMDWNLPHVVRVHMDADRRLDTVTSNCIFLTTLPESRIPTNRNCWSTIVDQGRLMGNQIPVVNKKLLSMYLGQKNASWDIIAYYIGETKFYSINPTGQIIENDVPITLQIDSLLYILSHLYILLL